jgi:glycosyltransferase involved in cell wall biosynthesis
MAAGIPAIASDVGGIPEIMTDGKTGTLVPPRCPAALADAIAHILQNPAEAAALAASAKKQVANFTPDAYHQAMVEIYRRVLIKSAGRF